MNEKLKELADNATLYANDICDHDPDADWYELRDLKFAELVRQDEREQCAKDYLEDCARAVEQARLEEREACAIECELTWKRSATQHYASLTYSNAANDCAAAIRGRTE